MNQLRLLLCLSLVAPSCMAHLDIRSYKNFSASEEQGWHFLKEVLITQPTKKVHTLIGQQGASLLAAAGSGLLCYAAGKKITGHYHTTAKLCSLGAALMTSTFTYTALQEYLLEQEEHKQLTKILEMWDLFYDKLPHDALTALEALHATWSTHPEAYAIHAEKVLSFIKLELRNRYPSKPEPFFNSRTMQVRLHLDLYETAVSLLTIGKHVLEALN